MLKPEILAPAGSFEALEAAVKCGADAVYVGGKEFSARRNAANFDDNELEAAVKFCHMRDAKLYLAVNTVVFDDETEKLSKFLLHAAKIGVDALIIQDFGTALLARSLLPDMPLHASTQMTIHTPKGAELAREMGFCRIVAARELSKGQLKELCDTGIEVEAFVHGALCMSVSGQCYMSALIGTRSANRGLCAQACRLPFSAAEGKERYDLSLKDLSLVPHLSELAEIGVSSFKIEGRMKRPEYVAAAVSACRASLDGKAVDMETLRAVFSRSGFTDGYFKGKTGGGMFGTREKEDVVSGNRVLPELKELYKKEIKKGKIRFEINIKSGEPARLCAFDEKGNTATVLGEIPEAAISRPSDMEQAERQLSKLGDTIYEFDGVFGEIEQGLLLPASALNDLRRRAVEELDKIRKANNTHVYTVGNIALPLPKRPKVKKEKPDLRLELFSAKVLGGLDLSDVQMAILPLEEFFSEDFKGKSEIFAAAPPRFMAGREAEIYKKLEILKEKGISKLYCQNPAHIKMGAELGLSLHGGFGLNAANSLALRELSRLSVLDAVLSFEMKFSEISRLSEAIPVGIIAYGKLPAMLAKNCPDKALYGCRNCPRKLFDKTKRSFDIVCNPDYVEILNSETLFLADKLSEIPDVDFLQLKFYRESADEINRICRLYKNGAESAPPKMTRGLYYRGIR